MGKKVTWIVLGIAVVLLVGYDIFAVIEWGVDATISAQITYLSQRFPIIPFAFGMLMGHFFTQWVTNSSSK